MEKKDRELFRSLMNRLRVSLPGPSLDEKEKALRIEVFWEELQQYPVEQVEAALREAQGKFKFFPTPVEIHELIRETIQITWNKLEEQREKEERRLLTHRISEGQQHFNQEKIKEILEDLNEKFNPKAELVLTEEDFLRIEERKSFLRKQAGELTLKN